MRPYIEGAAAFLLTVALVVLLGCGIADLTGTLPSWYHKPVVTRIVVKKSKAGVKTIYVLNHASQYISNKEIRHDIPAWEYAANKQFAPVWGTPQVRIRLVAKAPAGADVALFKKDGPIQGALAFHFTPRGTPGIVVYAGTDDYYGFSNSVSFTHELEETLADPTISQTNQGWPYPTYEVGQQSLVQQKGTVWSNEVSDPVEAYSYKVKGVSISDFVTPNWFNDRVNGPYDFMRVVQQPFQITHGGYACFFTGSWNCVTNFRHAGKDSAGFFKGEKVVHDNH